MFKSLFSCFFLSLLLSQSLFGQKDTTDQKSSVRDILERIEASRRGSSGSSQGTSGGKTSTKQSTSDLDLSTKLVIGGIYLVRQEYKVKQNGTETGRGSKPYFGYANGIGVQVGNRLYVPNNLFKPWEFDQEYINVRLKYPDAVAGPVKFMQVTDTELKPQTVAIQCPDGNALPFMERNHDFSLVASQGTLSKDSSFLVLVSLDNPESESPYITTQTRFLDSDWDAKSALILEKYELPKQCVGGVLFHSAQRPGQLSIRVAGLAAIVGKDLVVNAIPAPSDTTGGRTGKKSDKNYKKAEKKAETPKAKPPKKAEPEGKPKADEQDKREQKRG